MQIKYLQKLKGKDKLETAENYSILFIFIGAVILSAGIGLNIISTTGFPTILAMLGALISFLSTIAMIAVWGLREFENEPNETNTSTTS